MKAIILAAGMGTRLGKYTKDLPKGLLSFLGRTLIERQIDTYRHAGIERIVLVGGYQADMLNFPGSTLYVNEEYETTNMVESLMCAREELRGEVVISYSDILFEDRVLRKVLEAPVDIGVAVDKVWRLYWEARYGDPSVDTESLAFGPDGNITAIGLPDPPFDEISGRYVGLMKFSGRGVVALKSVYDAAKASCWGNPWRSAATFQKGYMTDLLQEIIDFGYSVDPVLIEGGWLEFDTVEDYEKTRLWAETGELSRFCNVIEMPPETS